MSRLVPSGRPLSADPSIRRRRRVATALVLILMLSRTIGQDILGIKQNLIKDFVKNSDLKNSMREGVLPNDILRNYEKEDYQVAYGGYLRSNSTMLFQTNDAPNDNIYLANKTATTKWKTKKHRREKRGVTHLYNMIICATGCDPLSYKGYGCYCGFLGSGYPMDGIDRCCKMHDWCYDATNCPMFVEYFVPYYWKCYHGYKPICAIDHGKWGSSGSCAQRLCECDRSFAECLRRYRCPRRKAVCTSSPWRLIQNIFMIV